MIISVDGVATAVTVGSITKKILEKSKYGQNTTGGLLSAGMGAIYVPNNGCCYFNIQFLRGEIILK